MDAAEVPGAGGGWPALRVNDWIQTRDTVHMWTQIVGKIRMALTPMLNHWWHVTLYVTPRGLTTSTIPYGGGAFDIEFDFCDHQLHVRSSDGTAGTIVLEPKSVAAFHAEVFETLGRLGIQASIRAVPNEVEPAIPFAEDHQHASYDPGAIRTFWQQLIEADRVLKEFSSRFRGKASPVHLFWGGMDLAYARFSGRVAPAHPGGVPNCADWVMVEGYSHELSSCGFWPGVGEEGAFYAYTYPEPPGYAEYVNEADGVVYRQSDRLYLFPYENVRSAPDPDSKLLGFLHATYEAAAETGHWDREALEVDRDRWRR
ncbi:DUF5996 family protein [Arthrobacter sp. ok362]|uniref:DUF5996 family protein n=1 Tax=Arthrobacter sp. ok362 TaxID=1761745 RepID=UPI000885A390|nr:DUF5996 family protein [Arthrobacter sp. ok362]SDK94330.1 hypothetical protein SAMN04487913_104185 [Arthrobacter sp. ok362]